MHAALTVRGQLGRCTGDAGSTQILNALNDAVLEQLEAALDEDLLGKRIADLHGRPLGRLRIVERFGGEHRRSADAVAAGTRTEEHHTVADAGGVGQPDVLVPEDADGQSVDQRVALVDGVEDHFTADVRQPQGVSVSADTGHNAVDQTRGVRMVDRAEPQRIHDSDGTCAHRNDVADNAPDAGCRTLVGLNEGRVIVGFDLEGHGPAVPDIDDAGVLTDPHQEVFLHGVGDLVTELAQVHLRGLVGAVLAPHHRVHGQFRSGGPASEDLDDPLVLVFLQAQFGPGELLLRGLLGVFDGVDVELL